MQEFTMYSFELVFYLFNSRLLLDTNARKLLEIIYLSLINFEFLNLSKKRFVNIEFIECVDKISR